MCSFYCICVSVWSLWVPVCITALPPHSKTGKWQVLVNVVGGFGFVVKVVEKMGGSVL